MEVYALEDGYFDYPVVILWGRQNENEAVILVVCVTTKC